MDYCRVIHAMPAAMILMAAFGCRAGESPPKAPQSFQQANGASSDRGEAHEISRAPSGHVRLLYDGARIVLEIGEVHASIVSPYRAVKLGGILDAPDALAMLHDTLEADASTAELCAHYRFELDDGILDVTAHVRDQVATAVLGLSTNGGRCTAVTAISSSACQTLADNLRGFLINKWGRPERNQTTSF